MPPKPSIPMAHDVAEVIGTFAERVENRSLLLDKFSFHKCWPVFQENGQNLKWDEAHRWSFIRISHEGSTILNRDAAEKTRQANGQDVTHDKAERLRYEAIIATSLAHTNLNADLDVNRTRPHHTKRFLELFNTSYRDKSTFLIAKLEGRLALNLADGLIQNAGISLDRTFGLPVIPGSAVKGVARHTALQEIKATNDQPRKTRLIHAFCSIFGTSQNDFGENGELADLGFPINTIQHQDVKGCVSFLPAYPYNEAKIAVDITNVHTPQYYQSGNTADLKNESPQPNYFPVVEVGAKFAFCLILNGLNDQAAFLDQAKMWLTSALTISGIGAKTAAGYGWFSINPTDQDQLVAHFTQIQNQQQAQQQAATTKPCETTLVTLRNSNPQQNAGKLNAYRFEQRFWPTGYTVETMLAIYTYVTNEAPDLAITNNGATAMRNIRTYLNLP